MRFMFTVTLICFAIFACYHFWPAQTIHAGDRIEHVAKQGTMAAWNAATSDDMGHEEKHQK